MSTLASRRAPGLLLPDLTRFGAFLTALLDVFAEAQRRARAANERYPFAE